MANLSFIQQCRNAFGSNQVDRFRELLDGQIGQNMNVNCLLTMGDWTMLHYAVDYGSYDCAQVLLERGADPNIQSAQEYTPLHIAAMRGHAKCIQLLIEYGANCSIVDVDGATALEHAKDDATRDAFGGGLATKAAVAAVAWTLRK